MKPTVKLGGVNLAGNDTISWRLQTGTQPYTTTLQVHNRDWPRFEKLLGKATFLEIWDSRGTYTKISNVFILHKAPSGSPNRTAFVISDKRFWWQYMLIARDYNIPKRSGHRTRIGEFELRIPVEAAVTFDQFNFKPYSLKGGEEKWTAKDAVKDILQQLEADGTRGGGGWEIESFPIDDGGEFTLQNVVLRDQGDIALEKLLGFIPAAEVYIDVDGTAKVIDAADFRGAQAHYVSLPPRTWDGEKSEWIDRSGIRPKSVSVFYQREVEMLMDFQDNYNLTSTEGPKDVGTPYLENVIPTVDPETTLPDGVTELDPVTGDVNKTVAGGTYLIMDTWLKAMDADKPLNADGKPTSLPWTFAIISQKWIEGDLEGALGGDPSSGKDLLEDGNVQNRVRALRKNFRQTFRISRRYMERIRDIQAKRVALLDPVTGATAPSAIWGQATYKSNQKGLMVPSRFDPTKSHNMIGVDDYPPPTRSAIASVQSAAKIVIDDKDQGIFHVEWIEGVAGTDAQIIPCLTVNKAGEAAVTRRNVAFQEAEYMGTALMISGGSNGIYLKETMKMKAMVTITPGAPNNKRQFHVENVEISDIKDLFQKEYGISAGNGPVLEIYIPPGEATARFQWVDDTEAEKTIELLLGLNSDNPNDAGLQDDPETEGVDESQMNGFVLANSEQGQKSELTDHARSVAAEVLSAFADNRKGRVATELPPKDKLKLKGNMSGVTIQVAAAPSGKVNTVHEFPGQSKPISRFSLMSHDTRRIVLGIIPFGKGDG